VTRTSASVSEGVAVRKRHVVTGVRSVRRITILIALTVTSVSHGASEVELRIGASYTDNLLRDETGAIEETIAIAGATLDLSRQSRRFNSFLIGDLVYQRYTSGDFESETRPNLHAYLDFQFVPDVISWTFEDRYGQLVTDPFDADTLFNREKVNRFSTGPNLTLEFIGNNALDITGRYTDTRFEISDSGSERISANVGLVHGLAPNRKVSIHFVDESVTYDLPIYEDYDRREAYLEFESRISRGSLDLIVGANEVEYTDEPIRRPLYSLNLNRKISKLLSISLVYDRRIVDDSGQFGRSSSDLPGSGDGQGITPVGDTYETEEISFAVGRTKGRSQFSVGAYHAEDNYRSATSFNVTRTGVTAGYELALGSLWSFGIGGFLENRDFENEDFEDDNFELAVTFERRLTRTLGFQVEYRRVDRESPSDLNTYVENRYSLNLTYRPRPKSETETKAATESELE